MAKFTGFSADYRCVLNGIVDGSGYLLTDLLAAGILQNDLTKLGKFVLWHTKPEPAPLAKLNRKAITLKQEDKHLMY